MQRSTVPSNPFVLLFFFDSTGAGNSSGGGELRVFACFILTLAALTLRPCLPCFPADSAVVFRGCRPRKGHSPRYGCRSRSWKVSSVFLFGSSTMMPRSRPVRALPYPFSPTQQYGGPQDGSSPTASRPRYGRRSSLRGRRRIVISRSRFRGASLLSHL